MGHMMDFVFFSFWCYNLSSFGKVKILKKIFLGCGGFTQSF
jgi:hypothetical protein